jgi:hypothetical protein
MAARVALDRLQRWMQAVVVHPGTASDAIASKAAIRELRAERLQDVILPSRTLTPLDRIGVYHGMYLLRMHDALASDYEALRHFLGDESFFELVRAYVQVHPSRSYSLNRLGDRLPDFIERAPKVRHRGFAADLAKLECVAAQVFDAPESSSMTAETIAQVPGEAWECSRLTPIAAFRLVSLHYPANEYLQSLRDGDHDHPLPRRKREWIAVYRKDYAVRRLTLDRRAYELLGDLSRGLSLGNAVKRAMKRGGRPAKEEVLFKWFREWISSGLFQGVQPGRRQRRSPDRRKVVVRK